MLTHVTGNPGGNRAYQHVGEYLSARVDAYYFERLQPSWHGEHLVQGKEPGPGAIVLSSNDYLALSNHPEIIEAQVVELKRHGRGTLMSDVFRTGDHSLGRFEQAMAKLLQSEETVVCQSGWCANVGLIQAIAGPETPVYIDMFAHMSLWEGIAAAGARAVPFRHNQVQSLESLIHKHGPGYVLVDSVYSTSGTLAPLEKLCEVAEQYGCALVVDESHSLGVFGREGEGLVSARGLAPRVHFRTASLSKAFCMRGGIVAGPARTLKYFRYESRPAIFSSAVMSYEGATLCATLEVVRASQPARIRLLNIARDLRAALDALGYNVEASQSQIISLVPGEEERTRVLRDALEARNVFGAVFCSPATPKNKSLVRFSLHAALTRKELERIVAVCAEIREEVGMRDWASTHRRAAHEARRCA
jgi:CAI-1 autoinducer synthase